MSSSSSHSWVGSSLGNNSLPSTLSSHPNPLGSHPTSPVDEYPVSWPGKNNNSNSNSNSDSNGHHRREVSLPFYKSASESTFSTLSPNNTNFSTPDLSAFPNNNPNDSPRQHSPDNFSAALDTSFSNPSFSNPFTNPYSYRATSSTYNLSKASTSTMSSTQDLRPDQQRHDSLRTPIPPGSSAGSTARRDSKGMRKLFSLAGLRNSFSASRNSLVISDPIPQSRSVSQPMPEGPRPNSGSTTSSRGVKRGAEDDQLNPTKDNHSLQPPLRKRKSASWFRRKSGIFMFGSQGIASPVNQDGDMPLGPDAMMIDPTDTRPTTEHSMYSSAPPSSHRVPVANSPPKLPPLPRTSHSAVSPTDSSPAERPISRLSSRPSSQQQQQQQQQTFRPSSRDVWSPPPTLPELGNLGGGFSEDTDMFANIGR